MNIPKPKRVKDPEWLKAVRLMPCVNYSKGECRTYDTIGHGPSEASHLAGKSLDSHTVPMCGGCHRTHRYSWHHGKKSFCLHFGWTEDELLAVARSSYAAWKR